MYDCFFFLTTLNLEHRKDKKNVETKYLQTTLNDALNKSQFVGVFAFFGVEDALLVESVYAHFSRGVNNEVIL
jgi:hypothetical protein